MILSQGSVTQHLQLLTGGPIHLVLPPLCINYPRVLVSMLEVLKGLRVLVVLNEVKVTELLTFV